MGFHIRENIKKLFAFIKADWKFLIIVIFMAFYAYELVQIKSDVNYIVMDVIDIKSEVRSIQSDVRSIEVDISFRQR